MKPRFEVTVERFEKLAAMPEGWTAPDYRAVLGRLEFDGIDQIAEEELGAYAAMAAQDLEPEEAAQVVLEYVLAGKLTAGQIRNLAEEMKDERQWEEHADMRCHEPIFNAQVLLSEAFPKVYPAPDIVRLTVALEAISPAGEELLEDPVSEPLLVRMLADGMPATAILKRLFSEPLAKAPFVEASQILWQYTTEERPPSEGRSLARTVVIYSSRYWMGPLEDADPFVSAAFPDPD